MSLFPESLGFSSEHATNALPQADINPLSLEPINDKSLGSWAQVEAERRCLGGQYVGANFTLNPNLRFVNVSTEDIQNGRRSQLPQGKKEKKIGLSGMFGLMGAKTLHDQQKDLGDPTPETRRTALKWLGRGAVATVATYLGFKDVATELVHADTSAILPALLNGSEFPQVRVTTTPTPEASTPTSTPSPTMIPTGAPTEPGTNTPTHEPPPTLTPTPEATKKPDNDLETLLKKFPESRDAIGPVELEENTCSFWYEVAYGGAEDIPEDVRQFCLHGRLQSSRNLKQGFLEGAMYPEDVFFATEHGHFGITQHTTITTDPESGKKIPKYSYRVYHAPVLFQTTPVEATPLIVECNVDNVEFAIEVDRDTGHVNVVLHFEGVEEPDPDNKSQMKLVNKTFAVPIDVKSEDPDYLARVGKRAISAARGFGDFAKSRFEMKLRYKQSDVEILSLNEPDAMSVTHAKGGMYTYAEAVPEQIAMRTNPTGPRNIFRYFNRADYTAGVLRGALGSSRRMFTHPTNQCWYSSIKTELETIVARGWTQPFWRQFRSILPLEKFRNLPADIQSSTIDYSGLQQDTPELFNLDTSTGRLSARQRVTDCLNSIIRVSQDPQFGAEKPVIVVWDCASESPKYDKAYSDAGLPHSFYVEGIKQAQDMGARYVAIREDNTFGSSRSKVERVRQFATFKSRIQQCAEADEPITNLTLVAGGTISASNIDISLNGADNSIKTLLNQINQLNSELKSNTPSLQDSPPEIMPIGHIIFDIYIDHAGTTPENRRANIKAVREALFVLRQESNIPFSISIRMAEDVAAMAPERKPSALQTLTRRILDHYVHGQEVK